MSMHKLNWDNSDIPKFPPKENTKINKIIIPITLAIITTLSQVILVNSCTSNANTLVSDYVVAIAANNIPAGGTLTPENVKLSAVNIQHGENFILQSELSSYLGSKVLVKTDANTPILKNSLLGNFQEKNIPEKIPPGKRLFAIKADLGSLASILHIADRVDIIAHLELPEFGHVTETILERVEIIGIGENLNNIQTYAGEHTTLSFYLTPEEVKIISFMQQYAKFSISLRNPKDFTINHSTAVTFNKFIQDERIQQIINNDAFKIRIGEKINGLENNR